MVLSGVDCAPYRARYIVFLPCTFQMYEVRNEVETLFLSSRPTHSLDLLLDVFAFKWAPDELNRKMLYEWAHTGEETENIERRMANLFLCVSIVCVHDFGSSVEDFCAHGVIALLIGKLLN